MYAKIIDGVANNPVPAETREEVAKYFNAEWLSRQGGVEAWKEVPNGTQHGAKDNGDGTFTNPPGPKTIPITMTDKQFRQHVQKKLGAGVYGKAFKDASQSNDGAVLDAYAAWSKATTYDKAEVAAFTDALVTAGILTSQQRALLVGNGNWPEA